MRTARLCVGVVAVGLLALLGSARGYDQSLGDCKAVAELFLNTCDHGDYDKPALCVTKSSSRQKRPPCMRSLLRPNMRCELHVCTARTQTDHARVCTKRWALAMPVGGPVCARPPALAPCLCEHWPIGARPVVVWRGTRFFDLLLALARCARRAPGMRGVPFTCPNKKTCIASGVADGTDCTWQRRVCVTCRVVAGETKIRVQTNNLPNHCMAVRATLRLPRRRRCVPTPGG